METPFLETKGLAVGYRGKALISGIRLTLDRGEILALIGPNGAGKTTILKSLIRQLAPIGGSVLLEGRDMAALGNRELARQMACMLTVRHQTELLTVRDVVSAGRYPYTGSFGILSEKDHRAVDEAMVQTAVADLADRPFDQISDGQRQRVLLARALCQEPDLLVLDEPTSFLDLHYKLEFLSMLRRLARERQMAVLLSMHELELAQRAADRIVCVRGEEIAACGRPEEIFTGDRISFLFDLRPDCYDPVSGTAELEKCPGIPTVFVIAGAGYGTPVFRQLTRAGIPFTAGILWENDLDHPAAAALAAELVTVPAFSPVTDAALDRARALMAGCGSVIAALPVVMMQGQAAPLQLLAAEAEAAGKLMTAEALIRRTRSVSDHEL